MAESRSPEQLREALQELADAARQQSEALPVVTEGDAKLAEVSRRAFLRLGAMAGAGASVAGIVPFSSPARADDLTDEEAVPKSDPGPTDFNEATVVQLQSLMAKGKLNSYELTLFYVQRIRAIDQGGPNLNSIIQINPDAFAIAHALDVERKSKGPRGPLHGIPVLLKDNYDTADKMMTTAGSLAMVGPAAPKDSTVAARLRLAGAVILGKTNLSEWANFRSSVSSSGWSGRGGQCNNPYVLPANPCGSSSGSGAGVSANLSAVSMGTETDGSIVCPASINGVVGIKPTLGLTSRAGVIPIAHSQDVTGPHCRTVADAAAVLSALVGVDPRDPATAGSAGKFSTDYTKFLDPNGLKGARIGVTRAVYTGYSVHTDTLYEGAIAAMKSAGAVIVDPADIPTAQAINSDPSEFNVLVYEFLRDMNAYLATRTGLAAHTLADLIAINNALASKELQFFDQALFELCQSDPVTASDYAASVIKERQLGGAQGIDAALAKDNLDALIAPVSSPSWTTDLVNGDHFLGASSSPCAIAGYPSVVVTMGQSLGLPVGLAIMGTAYSEGKLLKIAFAFEQATKLRKAPKFLPSVATNNGRTPVSKAAPERQESNQGQVWQHEGAEFPLTRMRGLL
ncbi:MAG TPA: amidase [Thermoanaerobaculia bacterium]|nr:amidase [Thermoanaerobaculia bacterium]